MRRHGWIRHFVSDFETNPRFQFKFHLWAMVFWLLNLAVGTTVMICWNQYWLKIGVFYVFIISIYANWDTDYDACSASLAAMHSEDLLKRQP
jgi:hypothetical protein